MTVLPIKIDEKEFPKFERITGILQGLAVSATNAVIFRDEPEVWFQFYLGLFLERPTFVLIQKADMNKEIEQ